MVHKRRSLTEQWERRCVDWILDFRKDDHDDEEDRDDRDREGLSDVWRHADLMTDYIRSLDHGAKRMKFQQLEGIVARGLWMGWMWGGLACDGLSHSSLLSWSIWLRSL